MFKSVFIKNFLSFGEKGTSFPLRNLNVLIGANGVGKSNFFRAFELLECLYRGYSTFSFDRVRHPNNFSLLYKNGVASSQFELGFELEKEGKSFGFTFEPSVSRDDCVKFSLKHFQISSFMVDGEVKDWKKDSDFLLGVVSGSSAFSVVKTGENRLFCLEFTGGEKEVFPFLNEAGREAMDGFHSFDVNRCGSDKDVFAVFEDGTRIPFSLCSEGFKFYLNLVWWLERPSNKCLLIESPEKYLHFDLFPDLARRIKKASETKQVILTTQSPLFLNCFQDTVESVCLVESGRDGTTLERLDAVKMRAWTSKYSLGDLWVSGQLGAKRW